jgi:hypothetical protein
VSTATLSAVGLRSRHSAFDSSSGVSESAAQFRGRLRHFIEDAVRSATGQRRLMQPWLALLEQYGEAQTLAGDGEFSVPSDAAMREAELLMSALPPWAPPMTPLVEPSGTIALEWDVAPSRFLVLAVNGTGKLQHSAILGLGNEYHGSTNFSGALPDVALTLLASLLRAHQ